MNNLFIMIILAISGSQVATAGERYTTAEEEALSSKLHSLDGKQKNCAVSFVQGYEQYAYPHCLRYNRRDREFCEFYKDAVPTSVIETALHICKIKWSVIQPASDPTAEQKVAKQ